MPAPAGNRARAALRASAKKAKRRGVEPAPAPVPVPVPAHTVGLRPQTTQPAAPSPHDGHLVPAGAPISVPAALISQMRASLESEGRKFTLSELKAVVSAFWSSAVAHLLDPSGGHRLNVSNILTLRLYEGEATRPRRWHLEVDAKDRQKAALDAHFSRR